MTTDSRAARGGWLNPMVQRSPDEEHRTSTPLELFFDLVFVVAIAQVSGRLHHGITSNHVGETLLSYGMVFFAIWWAWMNFTWFASTYDNDDVVYRLVVFVQLIGALMLAAGVTAAFDSNNWALVTFGYVVMRAAMICQMIRVARDDPAGRPAAMRGAIGVALCQAGWVSLLFSPASWLLSGFFLLILAEVSVPLWAQRAGPTSWHREHIIERYGLFTIIVLGESILAASTAIQTATQGGTLASDLRTTVVGGVLIVFSLWWLYFSQPEHDLSSRLRMFLWGYSHLPIFAAAAAVGAGVAVSIDFLDGNAAIGAVGAGAAVAIPVAIYLLFLWALHLRRGRSLLKVALFPFFAALILLTPLTREPVFLTGLLVAGLLAFKLYQQHRARLATVVEWNEDAMQVAAATACNADVIATRNFQDFRGSPIPAM